MKINKKRVLLLILALEMLLILSSSINVMSFKIGSITRDNPNHKNFDMASWYSNSYSTHDWISHAALRAILRDENAGPMWVGTNGYNFWTEKRKIIFYIGTEAPDVGRKVLRLYFNGKWISGLKTKTHLDFYNNTEGDDKRMKLKKVHSFYHQARMWSKMAMSYLSQGKCDLAAFYMGAVVHCIQDMATLCHVYTFNYWSKDHHNHFERAIEKETHEIKNGDPKVKAFTYAKAFPIQSVDAGEAILLVSFNTRWDCWIDMNQWWEEPFDETVVPGDDAAHIMYDDLYAKLPNRESELNVKFWHWQLKNRVQENLDTAVKYTAYYINYVASSWNKECSDCTQKQEEQSITDWKRIGLAVTILISFGLASALGVPFFQIMIRVSKKI